MSEKRVKEKTYLNKMLNTGENYTLEEFIKMSRERIGITERQGGHILQITEKEYIELETGQKQFTKEMLNTLCTKYKMPKSIKKLAFDPNKPLYALKLGELRTKANKSQQELSEIIGVAQTTYAGYENGKREPDIQTLIKIADYYKVSVDYIIGRYK